MLLKFPCHFSLFVGNVKSFGYGILPVALCPRYEVNCLFRNHNQCALYEETFFVQNGEIPHLRKGRYWAIGAVERGLEGGDGV